MQAPAQRQIVGAAGGVAEPDFGPTTYLRTGLGRPASGADQAKLLY